MRRLLVWIQVALAAITIVVCFFACKRNDRLSPAPTEKVTIAYAATTDAVLAEVAHSRGYYREEGLEADPHLHPYGKLALEDVLKGNADFATVAETPVMFAIMRGEKISIIATIQTSSKNSSIIVRKDKGILTLKDLKGRKIATTLGTTSEFFLDAMLATHGISRNDVKVIDLMAEGIPAALANGEVDAASAFTPYVNFAQDKLGDRGITFYNEDIYIGTFNVVATQEFIRNNPGKVKKMLRALIKAEEFVKQNPDKAQKIVAGFSGMNIAIVRDIWTHTSFSVSLDQSLLLALEDETRWAINGRLTDVKKIPNYLEFIYTDGLVSVKPKAVKILR
jgi:ABC-type nitrate/sulfonate/bicarbonate transport system substrate-binding protein